MDGSIYKTLNQLLGVVWGEKWGNVALPWQCPLPGGEEEPVADPLMPVSVQHWLSG